MYSVDGMHTNGIPPTHSDSLPCGHVRYRVITEIMIEVVSECGVEQCMSFFDLQKQLH